MKKNAIDSFMDYVEGKADEVDNYLESGKDIEAQVVWGEVRQELGRVRGFKAISTDYLDAMRIFNQKTREYKDKGLNVAMVEGF